MRTKCLFCNLTSPNTTHMTNQCNQRYLFLFFILLVPNILQDALVFHVGMRRYTCQPIFSTASPGNPKQKFERFLQPARPCSASIYGPVTFPPSPLLVFSTGMLTNSILIGYQIYLWREDGELVATGSLHAVDPDRIIVKKIILTGRPYKVHKKSAVIRDMFYFPGMH